MTDIGCCWIESAAIEYALDLLRGESDPLSADVNTIVTPTFFVLSPRDNFITAHAIGALVTFWGDVRF